MNLSTGHSHRKLGPLKVLTLELSRQIQDIEGLDGYRGLKVLVRLHGTPIGYVTMPLFGGRCTGEALVKTILDQHSWTIMRHLLRNGLTAPVPPTGLRISNLVTMAAPNYTGSLPLVTIAVCTRDRTADLSICLEAISRLDYPRLDILVVDNAPKTGATEQLVRTKYPNMRYCCEHRPGLNWTRNRAIIEALGEIIAFTDDDAVADPRWISAIARVFTENPEVMGVTGLVVPYELETDAQILFEMSGGFGRGFERKWYRLDHESGQKQIYHIGAGVFGTGANMAFRRNLFDEVGSFDPALDVGTVTGGGGDLEMFFRVLQEGYSLVYEPEAIVRHRHRRDYAQLHSQLFNNGVGLYSYFTRSALAYPRQSLSFIHFGLWWLWRGHIRRLLINSMRPSRFPIDLILAELKGSVIGPLRYVKARRTAAKIEHTVVHLKYNKIHQELAALRVTKETKTVQRQRAQYRKKRRNQSVIRFPTPLNPTAIRTVDLSQPLQALTDVLEYNCVQIVVTLNNRLLGTVYIPNLRQSISATRLREAIVDGVFLKLLEPGRKMSTDTIWAWALAALTNHYMPRELEEFPLPSDVPVSVVVATRDRPDDLQDCLHCLFAQKTERRVEIVVVDNNPASGLTTAAVAKFPDIVYVSQQRKGLAYARNAGFAASTGDIVITTDDDVVIPPTWLEKLVQHFTRHDVMAVTGNVLPLEMETVAQQLFEEYGGLGRGFEQFEVSGDWFENQRYQAVPTWKLGATANAAFRASIFSDPRIGLMHEALGPGMPSGVGEDTYLFYKILKADHTIVYEPDAYIWHKHRRDMRALRRQIYDYSKGHVAYHLTTLLRDRDLRALFNLTVGLWKWHMWHFRNRLFGRSTYTLSLIMLEILGNLIGPFALWKSHRRVKREGRSEPYVSVSQRTTIGHELMASTAQTSALRSPSEGS